jgi:hypothetical protein
MRILTTSKRMIAFAAVLAGVALATPNQARADLELSWSASTTLLGSDPTDTSIVLTSNVTSGVFTLDSGFSGKGTNNGTFGTGAAGLDIGGLTVSSTGAGSVTIYLTQTNQMVPTGLGTLTATVTGGFTTGGGTASLVAYGNDTNLAYGNATGQAGTSPPLSGTSNVATTATLGVNNGKSSTAFSATAPYSMTEALTITFTSGGGSASFSTDSFTTFAATAPEPGTIAMALTALPLLGLGAWARRRRTVA